MLRVHCAVPEMRPEYFDRLVQHLHRVSAVIASGKRPVPFRTRKLSPTAPMVLRGGPRGRVGRRRTFFEDGHPVHTGWPSSAVPTLPSSRARGCSCLPIAALLRESALTTSRRPVWLPGCWVDCGCSAGGGDHVGQRLLPS